MFLNQYFQLNLNLNKVRSSNYTKRKQDPARVNVTPRNRRIHSTKQPTDRCVYYRYLIDFYISHHAILSCCLLVTVIVLMLLSSYLAFQLCRCLRCRSFLYFVNVSNDELALAQSGWMLLCTFFTCVLCTSSAAVVT